MGKLTNKEALRAVGEMLSTSDEENKRHYFEVVDKIIEKDLPSYVEDDELVSRWWDETHED